MTTRSYARLGLSAALLASTLCLFWSGEAISSAPLPGDSAPLPGEAPVNQSPSASPSFGEPSKTDSKSDPPGIVVGEAAAGNGKAAGLPTPGEPQPSPVPLSSGSSPDPAIDSALPIQKPVTTRAGQAQTAADSSPALIEEGLPPFDPGVSNPDVVVSKLDPKALKAALKQWKKLQKDGQEAFIRCEYGKAERILTAAVEMAKDIGPDNPKLSSSFGELGRLLTVRGRFDEAEPYLEQELYLKDRVIGNKQGEIIKDMGKMVEFYLEYGTKSKAEPLTEEIIAFVQGKYRDEIAKTRKAKLSVKKGQPLVGWAGTAAPPLRDPILEWAITCDKLGERYRILRNYDLADRLFKTSLDVKATVFGKKHLSLANSYDSLGTICMAKGENQEAESYIRDSLSITRKILSPGNPKVYARQDKLARALMKQGKFADAERVYREVTDFWSTKKSRSGIEQRALFRLGVLYTKMKRYASAATVLRKALRLAERFHGRDSIQLVPYLRQYAYVSYYAGNRGAHSHLKARANSIAPVVKALKPKVKMGRIEQKTN